MTWESYRSLRFHYFGDDDTMKRQTFKQCFRKFSSYVDAERLAPKDELPTFGLYSDLASQRYIMDRMATLMKIKNWQDWYSIKQSDITKIGGANLIRHYFGGSLIRALLKIYPEHDWKLHKFHVVPSGYWKDKENRRNFLTSITSELNVKSMDDWRLIKTDDIKKLGGSGLLSIYNGSFKKALLDTFPEHPWNVNQENIFQYKENGVPSLGKAQMRLFTMIKDEVFPEQEIFSNYVINEKLKIEVDIAIPKLNIAFEYQGEMHFKDQEKKMFLDEKRWKKDEEKRKYCKENNITLIDVPFWWNGALESLKATIFKHRPEFFASKPEGKPIMTLEELPKPTYNMARSKNPYRIRSKASIK